MNDLTLGASLDDPMVPDDDNPTISMQAVGDDPAVLPWQTRQTYRLNIALTPDGLSRASAAVGNYQHHPQCPGPGAPWLAHCAIITAADDDIHGHDMRAWFATHEQAIAAVETHIAACIEELLGDEVDR